MIFDSITFISRSFSSYSIDHSNSTSDHSMNTTLTSWLCSELMTRIFWLYESVLMVALQLQIYIEKIQLKHLLVYREREKVFLRLKKWFHVLPKVFVMLASPINDTTAFRTLMKPISMEHKHNLSEKITRHNGLF